MGYRNTLVEAGHVTAMLDMDRARRFAQPIKLAKDMPWTAPPSTAVSER